MIIVFYCVALHYLLLSGASDHLWVDENDFDTVCDTKVLHHGGTGLLKKMDSTGQSAKLLAYAKSKGVITTLDLIAPNESTINVLKEVLPHVDYFMPSMEEALFISKMSTPKDAADFFLSIMNAGGHGSGTCIFKWGEKGSYVKSMSSSFNDPIIIPAYRVTVKDTTGCGDSYCGGFIAGLVRGEGLLESCRLGTATSALVATGLGSDAGVIDFESTKQFMDTTETYPPCEHSLLDPNIC